MLAFMLHNPGNSAGDLFGMVFCDPFNRESWPPTIGDEKVTVCITWIKFIFLSQLKEDLWNMDEYGIVIVKVKELHYATDLGIFGKNTERSLVTFT